MTAHRRGFTLLELLAVIAIIAILSGLGAKGYALSRRKAKESQAKAEIEKLRTVLVEYRIEYGTYPSGLSDLHDLSNQVVHLEFSDPWGNPYKYERSDRFLYRIWSEGADQETTADNIEPTETGY